LRANLQLDWTPGTSSTLQDRRELATPPLQIRGAKGGESAFGEPGTLSTSTINLSKINEFSGQLYHTKRASIE
jgi:hypothetical protein